MKLASPLSKQAPLKMVGSSVFGRYSKISVEETWNMIISDDFLVDYAGFKNVLPLNAAGVGRGIFNSERLGALIVVVGSAVYVVDDNITAAQIGTLDTSTGDVFISENDTNEIAITDKKDLYVYDYIASSFTKITLDFQPGYIDFQNGYLIAPAIPFTFPQVGSPTWRLSALNDATTWPSINTGTFQTKADQPLACIRFPGRGNQLFVMGGIVTEAWFNTGGQLFPYTRSNSYNIDYGCLNPATIAASDKFIVWLAANEKSGPVIMYSTGGDPQHISTDGIDFKLAELNNPEDSFGFLFKQDGHLIYQFTFKSDNLSFAYDFNTRKFFNLCDENMNYHPARRVAYFNNTYYFVSANDGNLYEFSTQYTNYDYGDEVFEIPRIRITDTFRLPDGTPFVTQNAGFVIEQGVNEIPGRVDLSISKNGGQTFSNTVSMDMNPQGDYRNRFYYWNLGRSNEMTCQFRFWGFGRFVVSNGTMGVYQ